MPRNDCEYALEDYLEEWLVEKLYSVITANGEVLYTDCTKSEATKLKLELVAIDVANEEYQQGFYAIVEQ